MTPKKFEILASRKPTVKHFEVVKLANGDLVGVEVHKVKTAVVKLVEKTKYTIRRGTSK